MLDAWVGLAWPLRSEATTSRALRELQIMRVAALTRASFEWHAHWPAAIRAGATPQQLEALGDPASSDLFDDREKATLRCTDEIIIDGSASADAVRQLRDLFSNAECIELLLTAAFYSCVSGTLLSLGVEAPDEPDSEPLGVYRAVTNDEDRQRVNQANAQRCPASAVAGRPGDSASALSAISRIVARCSRTPG